MADPAAQRPTLSMLLTGRGLRRLPPRQRLFADLLGGVLIFAVLLLMAVLFEQLRDNAALYIGVFLVVWPLVAVARYYLARRGELL